MARVCFLACTLSCLSFLLLVSGGQGQDTGVILQCNFEDENETIAWCGFTHDADDDFDWTLHQGSTGSQNTGPEVDHTYGTLEGHYIYTEASQPRTQGHIARILSPVMSASTTPTCFTFFYQMNGQDSGRLDVYLKVVNETDRSLLKSWSGHQDTQWLKHGITITPQSSDYQIIFESEVGESYRGDIALDDIWFLDNKVCAHDDLTCDFESMNICGFTQGTTDDFDFVRNSGSTDSWGTGPRHDHTYKNESGHYMYIEVTTVQEGHVARLISPMMAPHSMQDKPSCLIFYYHMFGYMMGELRVYIKNSTSDDIGDPVWSLEGNRGDRWRAAEVLINTPYEYQVIFEAERGEGFQGDISIDDVEIKQKDCPGVHYIDHSPSVTCDFEEAEICQYTQNTDDEFDWVWSNRGTWFRFTGPEVDHTLGNELGFFLYIDEAWVAPRNARARITSPEAPPQRRPSCLEFWYHMLGKDIETLNVYIVPSNSQLPSTPDWTMSGDQGDYWHRATVDINIINRPFKVVFEGSRGVWLQDDIALDDVTLHKSQDCPPFTTQAPTTTMTPQPLRTFQCDFEVDYCGMTNSYEDILDWTRHKGVITWNWWKDSVKKDHTLGTSEGYFLTMKLLDWWYRDPNDNGRIDTPLLAGSSSPRCLSFWFIHFGYWADYFNVYIRKHGETLSIDPDLVFYGDHGMEWSQAFLDIPPSTEPFHIVFEGIMDKMWAATETAIDDLQLMNGKCVRPTPTSAPITANCAFEDNEGEDGMCGYTQEELEDRWWKAPDKFHWRRNVKTTGTNGTGPSSDHTHRNDSGTYLYAEASQPRRPGDKARITTPALATTYERICLHFYYYLWGDDMGRLSVLWSAPNFDEKQILRVKKQADRWQSAYVEIKDIVDNYKITFQAEIGKGNKGDIAIDDIRFLRQPCQGFEPESSCSFEDGGYEQCNYKQADVDFREWVWFDSRGTETSPLGNNSDLVGSFLYIISDTKTPSDTAILYPPKVPTKAMDHCISYDVVVQDSTSMNLFLAVEFKNSSFRMVQMVNRSNAPKWTHFDIDLDMSLLPEDPFQIKFVANFGTNRTMGIIAIDNVTIAQATCSIVKARLAAEKRQSLAGNYGGGGSSKASVALGIILTLVIVGVIIVLVAWLYIKRSGFGKPPFEIKYKNSDSDNANPVSLPDEGGIANPVYKKSDLA